MDYKARFYSPLLGRFTQPDSIVPNPINPQAWNRFSYVINNPVLYADPSGHSQCRTQEDCEDMGTTPMGGNSGLNSGGSGSGNGGPTEVDDRNDPLDDPEGDFPILPYTPIRGFGPQCLNNNRNRIFVGEPVTSGRLLSGGGGICGPYSAIADGNVYLNEDAILGGSNGFVLYNASWSVQVYERLTILTIYENYYFSGTMPVPDGNQSAATILVGNLSGGQTVNLPLGYLDTTSPPLPQISPTILDREFVHRETDVYFYDSVNRPENISVLVAIQTGGSAHPIVNYNFPSQPGVFFS